MGLRGQKNRLARLEVAPFEATIGVLSVVSGLAGLFHFGMPDPLNATLPRWEASTFQTTYLLSGLCVFIGILGGSFRLEAAGLVLLATSVLVRAVVIIRLLGVHADALVGSVFFLTILGACTLRIGVLLRGVVTVQVKPADVGS